MKAFRWAAIALVAPLLTACLDVEQTLQVDSERRAALEVTLSVAPSIIAMAQQYPQAAGRDFCTQPLKPNVHGLALTVQSSTRGEEQVCVMRASGTLAAIAQVLNDKLYLPHNAPPQAKALEYRLEDQGGGVWRLAMTLTPPPELLALAGTTDMARSAQMMMLGPVDGRAITWSVSADGIVDSTGEISADGRRAEFSVPLPDVLARPQASYSFETTFRVGR